ncbi:hypothetical protein TNCV_2445141 [Trichonephila clavipes]|nr:hypothetical protein TNCV_2445141 [Trichonephila clavipes]
MYYHDPKIQEPWKAMGNLGHCRYYPKAPGENRGRCPLSLITWHVFLGVYIHCVCLTADETCPLCDHARMDGEPLIKCTGLDEHPTNDVVNRYREARRQMAKKPSAGVGQIKK